MRNRLGDLNDLLFEQLERLSNDDLNKEELEAELHRANGMSKIASQIIANGKLVLDAEKFMCDYELVHGEEKLLPEFLRGEE